MAGTDTTFAVVAVTATGVVGLAGPTITGLFGKAHQSRELQHRAALEQLEARRRVLLHAIECITEVESLLISGVVVTDPNGVVSLQSPTGNIHDKRHAVDTQERILSAWFGQANGSVATAYTNWDLQILQGILERLRGEPIGPARKQLLAATRDAFFEHARPHLDLPVNTSPALIITE